MTTATLDVKVTEIGALKARVLTFPRALYDARLTAANADTLVKDLKGAIADAEVEAASLATLEVALASEADGKKKYTNDEQRKAAAKLAAAAALTKDAAYQEQLKRLREAESEAMNAHLLVGRLEDEHRGYHKVVDLTVAEVALLTAGR